MASNYNADGDFFTFRIGRKQQIFQVDKAVVAQASPVFERMMNSGMKETHEKVADLPEVDSVTFLRFLTFAHNAAGLHGDATEEQEPPKEYPLTLGTLTVLLLDSGQKHYSCSNRACRSVQKLAFSNTFPTCPSCVEQLKHKGIEPFNKCCAMQDCSAENPNIALSIICINCAYTLGILKQSDWYSKRTENAQKLLSFSVSRLKWDPEFFRFDAPIFVKDVAEEIRSTFSAPNLVFRHPFEALQLFMFAETYCIDGLRKLGLMALFETLACNHHSIEDVVDLVKFIYENTPDSGFTATITSKHVLRRMISAYFAYHGPELQARPEIHTLLCSGLEFGPDLFMAMSMIAAGNLGKGWKEGERLTDSED